MLCWVGFVVGFDPSFCARFDGLPVCREIQSSPPSVGLGIGEGTSLRSAIESLREELEERIKEGEGVLGIAKTLSHTNVEAAPGVLP